MDERLGPWETRDQLLAAALAAGYAVSAAQLGRLHRAGLVPRPEVRSLGRGRGTVSRYPVGSAARLARVAEVQAVEHRLTYTAWRLWWEEGGQLPAPARELLAQISDGWQRARAQLGEMLAGDEAGDPVATAAMDDFYRQAENDRLVAPLGEARRNTGRERFSTVMRVFAEVATGRFEGYDDQDPTVSALVDRAFGLESARIDHLANADPWLTGTSDADFARLSRTLGTRSLEAEASAPDDELDQARIELRSFLAIISTIAPLFERLFGRAAFGFGLIGRALATDTPRRQAFILLGWTALRGEPALREGMQRMLGVAPVADATARIYELMQELRRQVPAFGPVLTDERLAAAQRDAVEAERLRAAIGDVRVANRTEVDAFFASHPAADELIKRLDQPVP